MRTPVTPRRSRRRRSAEWSCLSSGDPPPARPARGGARRNAFPPLSGRPPVASDRKGGERRASDRAQERLREGSRGSRPASRRLPIAAGGRAFVGRRGDRRQPPGALYGGGPRSRGRAARRAAAPIEYPGSRDAAFGLVLVICALLAGRINDPLRIGVALALAFLAVETRFGGIDSLPPGTVAALSLGWVVLPFTLPALAGGPISGRHRLAPLAGYLLFAAALYAAGGLSAERAGPRAGRVSHRRRHPVARPVARLRRRRSGGPSRGRAPLANRPRDRAAGADRSDRRLRSRVPPLAGGGIEAPATSI